MIQSITNGIIKAIRTEYDKSYRIYTESIEQGLIEPCFSILCLNAEGNREVGDRFKRYFPFMITYFPSGDEPIAECNEVCEVLLGLLNDIETDIGLVHATDIPSGRVIDGNLQFNVQYRVPTMLKRELEEAMSELNSNVDAI